MHEVLVSYSTKDKKWAEAACSVLESRGIRCWIAPRDIIPGTEWAEAIITGIDACKVMVLIFSASANASPHVRREVGRAISKGLTVVPCRVENVRPVGAMDYALGNTHWLDVFTPPVERQMKRLAETVQGLLGRDRGASSTVDVPPLPSDRTRQNASLRGSKTPKWNIRRKHGLIAAAALALVLLLAVSLIGIYWHRKDSASTPKNATTSVLESIPAGQTASTAKSVVAATSPSRSKNGSSSRGSPRNETAILNNSQVTAGLRHVRDGAGFFKSEIVAIVDNALALIAKRYGKELLIETWATVPADRVDAVKAMGKEARAQFFQEWGNSGPASGG